MKKIILLLILLNFTILFSEKTEAKENLTVYSYSSFVSKWGPGEKLKNIFEKTCHCQITYVSLDDGVSILNRLILEKNNTKADIILGLDMALIADAQDQSLSQPHNINLPNKMSLPISWDNQYYIPYDYGYFGFIYDENILKNPPQTFMQLLSHRFNKQILIQDPRTSAPGQGLLLWIQKLYGSDSQEIWSGLQSNIITVTKNWSEAYGLFLKNEGQLVLSYTTSPAYHQIVENKSNYKAAIFPEGHFLQVETASISSFSKNPKLAQKFLYFLLTDQAQEIIATTNWMYPVIDIDERLPIAFTELPKPKKALILDPKAIKDNRKAWIKDWRETMSHPE